VLGKIALDMTREKLAGLSQTIDQWEALTLGADFPN
jgi:hypothetical protein